MDYYSLSLSLSLSLSTFQYQSQQMRKTGGAGFVVESALQDLLRYADKYHEPVSNLNLAILGVASFVHSDHVYCPD